MKVFLLSSGGYTGSEDVFLPCEVKVALRAMVGGGYYISSDELIRVGWKEETLQSLDELFFYDHEVSFGEEE